MAVTWPLIRLGALPVATKGFTTEGTEVHEGNLGWRIIARR